MLAVVVAAAAVDTAGCDQRIALSRRQIDRSRMSRRRRCQRQPQRSTMTMALR